MDKTRTLPPLVRGQVTRVLEFFVDKIKFFRNILLLTDNFDLVLQVQWWGETLPALIRPKELQVKDRILKNSLESYYSEKYVIKTTSELFRLYLKTCEVLEVSVLEVVENYVIGSAFLRNLINLLNSNNELISMPIFDYLGEEIGEVIIHVNFSEKPEEKFEIKQNENAQHFKYNYLDKKFKKDCIMLKNSEDNFLSLGEKTLYYDGHFIQKNYQEKTFYKDWESQNNLYDFTKNVRTKNFDSNSMAEINESLKNQKESKSSIVRKKSSSESLLPNIKFLRDPSKVLFFGLSSKQFKPNNDIKNTKVKVPNKFSIESIKFNSRSKFPSDKSEYKKKKVLKTTASCRNISKKHVDLKKDKQFDSNVLLTEKSKNSEVFPDYKQTDVQSLSSKETSTTKVLDYLLGCDMSKENEEKALSDFKTMSPSHNLVDSISQLCLVSDNNAPESWNMPDSESICLKQSHLNFDFNNPIERDYYKKFFFKSSSCTDFEVAEFLNHPENCFKLGKSNSYKDAKLKNSQSSLKTCSKFLLAEDTTKNSVNEDYILNDVNINNRAQNCVHCKYYKKLSELDTIIDSLKHFEQKMIMYEKNSQKTDILIKNNHLVEGS